METQAIFPDGLTREEWVKLVHEKRNPFYQYPENQEVLIWRYIDFPKFVSILDSSSLYFPNACRLGDPFEGSISLENLKNRSEEIRGGGDSFYRFLKAHGVETTLEEIVEFKKIGWLIWRLIWSGASIGLMFLAGM